MKKKIRGKGYATDLTVGWVVKDLGPEWLQWQLFTAEWLANADAGIAQRLKAVKHFLYYLKIKAPYACEVASMFKGHTNGHKVSSEEFNSYLRDKGSFSQNRDYISNVIALCDYILLNHLSVEGDNSVPTPLFNNPFEQIKRIVSKTETVHSPLPYRYIQQLRQILCPYPAKSSSTKTPWIGRHFSDWRWAIDNLQLGNAGWMQVSPEIIDSSDPDCITRTRLVGKGKKAIEIYEIWSPVVAMLIFTKLHLPLRTYQVRFLDSGEGDTWRYEQGDWIENTIHSFKYGSTKRPYAKGVFRRTYDSMSESYSTSLYISTNKTADQNKDEVDRGYTIPWQHEELLYWLEKLRNWQEKYNPINRLTKGAELKISHLGGQKSRQQREEMGEFAFLFRSRGANFPISYTALASPWYRLLFKLEEDIFISGQTMENGDRYRFVKNYDDDLQINEISKVATNFPPHSLRVSLITCYTMDTDLPLPVISKLLAGHTRLLMTIYYNKITPSVMAEKMQEANASLEATGDASLKNFLMDAEIREIQLHCAYHTDKYNSLASVLAKRNPIGWEERVTGLCLVGGNTVRSDENSIVGGCWNGGPLLQDAKTPHSRSYAPVPNGPENCIRCRWHITDASYLPQLISQFNQISYRAHQAASISNEIEELLEALKDELFIAEESGDIFLKHSELQVLERRYEKQQGEADAYAKDYIAIFNLIKRVIQIENQRKKEDGGQKFVAIGSSEDLNVTIKFIETDSELLHLSLLCEDAELYPDIHDDLRKTPAIAKRTNMLSRMMARSDYQPVFLEMDEQTQLIVGNAITRKMAQIANPDDKLEGYRTVASYIEAYDYMVDSHLLDAGLAELNMFIPLRLPACSKKNISPVEID